MFDKKQYLKNALSNWAAFVVGAIIALAISPYLVRSLGDKDYGFWTLIMTFTGYYGFIDMGIRSAVIVYVTRYLANGEKEKLNELVNTALISLSVLGLVIVAFSFLISLVFPGMFKIEESSRYLVSATVTIVGVGVAAQFPAGVFNALLAGSQRYDISNFVVIVVRILTFVLILLSLKARLGLLYLGLITAGGEMAQGLLWWAWSKKLVPGLSINRKQFSKSTFIEIRNFGAFSFLINVSNQVIFFADTFLIGLMMDSIAVTYYAIGANLVPYMSRVIAALGQPLMQVAAGFDANNQSKSINTLYLMGTKYIFCIVGLLVALVLVLGNPFLTIWMGAKYVEGGIYGSSGTVLSLLALSQAFYLSQTVSRQILFAQKRNKAMAKVVVLEALANLILSIILIKKFGIIGVALGTLIPQVITDGLVFPLLMTKATGISLGRLWKESLLANLAILISTCILGFSLARVLPVTSWLNLMASGTLISVVYVSLALIAVVDGPSRILLFGKIKSVLGMR